MPYPKPYELDDILVEEYLSNTFHVERQITEYDSATDSNLHKFIFYLKGGVPITYLLAALATWFKNRNNSLCGIHWFIKLDLNTSVPCCVIFYRDEDATLFKLAFTDEHLKYSRNE